MYNRSGSSLYWLPPLIETRGASTLRLCGWSLWALWRSRGGRQLRLVGVRTSLRSSCWESPQITWTWLWGWVDQNRGRPGWLHKAQNQCRWAATLNLCNWCIPTCRCYISLCTWRTPCSCPSGDKSLVRSSDCQWCLAVWLNWRWLPGCCVLWNPGGEWRSQENRYKRIFLQGHSTVRPAGWCCSCKRSTVF